MATSKVYTVKYRRKREGKTNYKTRMKLLLGHKPRVVVRKSLKNIGLQITEFQHNGDKITSSAHSKELAKYGYKGHTGNTSAAYLTGYLLASKIKKKVTCVLDMGQHTSVKGSIIYAAIKGAKDGGLQIPCSNEVIPSDDRIQGKHVAEYAKKIKENKEKYKKQFGQYIKSNLDPENLPKHFEEVKKKIGAQ